RTSWRCLPTRLPWRCHRHLPAPSRRCMRSLVRRLRLGRLSWPIHPLEERRRQRRVRALMAWLRQERRFKFPLTSGDETVRRLLSAQSPLPPGLSRLLLRSGTWLASWISTFHALVAADQGGGSSWAIWRHSFGPEKARTSHARQNRLPTMASRELASNW